MKNKILALDVGNKRIGLAISDELGLFAHPLYTLHRKGIERDVEEIVKIISSHNVTDILVGLPKNMDGSLGKSAENSAEFKKLLESQTDLPIVSWDERRTTIAAANYLNETNTRGKKRKSVIDTLSASIILENLLNYRKNNFSAT